MNEYNERLFLGKRSSFVKSHLSRLPRTDEFWEADFSRSRYGAGTNGIMANFGFRPMGSRPMGYGG